MLGDAVGHWAIPQAPLDLLSGERGANSGLRRVDFLLAMPGAPPIVIEIDGQQHVDEEAVDDARTSQLHGAGYLVRRMAAQFASSGGVFGSDELTGWTAGTSDPAPERETLMVWGPSIASVLHGFRWPSDAGGQCERVRDRSGLTQIEEPATDSAAPSWDASPWPSRRSSRRAPLWAVPSTAWAVFARAVGHPAAHRSGARSPRRVAPLAAGSPIALSNVSVESSLTWPAEGSGGQPPLPSRTSSPRM